MAIKRAPSPQPNHNVLPAQLVQVNYWTETETRDREQGQALQSPETATHLLDITVSPVVSSLDKMAAHDIMQVDREIAALLTKMGYRVADDGFYIPSPMLHPSGQPHGQAFTFPPSSANHITTPQSTAYLAPPTVTSSNHLTPPVTPWYACDANAASTPLSQQRDDVHNGVQTSTNYFQYPEPAKKSPRRRAIPAPAPSRMTMTPTSGLLKEEPSTPRYTPDCQTSGQQLYSNPGYFTTIHHASSDVTNPTETSGYFSSVPHTPSDVTSVPHTPSDVTNTTETSGYFSSVPHTPSDVTSPTETSGYFSSVHHASSDVTNPTETSGYFSSVHHASSDVTSPTETSGYFSSVPNTPSDVSLAMVDDIMRSCAVVLGDCDIGLDDILEPDWTSCDALLSPDVKPTMVSTPVPIEIAPTALNGFSFNFPTSTPVNTTQGNVSSIYDPGSLYLKSEPITPNPAPFQSAHFLSNPASYHAGPAAEPAFKLQAVPGASLLQARRKARREAAKPYPTSSAVTSRSVNPKLHPCQYCPRSFTSKSGLRQHENTHTGERPFKCDFCPQSFAQRSTLRTHRRSMHTKEQPYKCDVCARAFSDYSTYVKHQRTHTGVKPYVCDICGRGFTQSGNLHRHQASKHKVKDVHLEATSQ